MNTTSPYSRRFAGAATTLATILLLAGAYEAQAQVLIDTRTGAAINAPAVAVDARTGAVVGTRPVVVDTRTGAAVGTRYDNRYYDNNGMWTDNRMDAGARLSAVDARVRTRAGTDSGRYYEDRRALGDTYYNGGYYGYDNGYRTYNRNTAIDARTGLAVDTRTGALVDADARSNTHLSKTIHTRSGSGVTSNTRTTGTAADMDANSKINVGY